ncbi:MAG TPA: sugar ABC transporter permease [Firmicutes bacterium]|jgi:alpha-glucoside transport system permease protein|nr:carbohydrate ABC transporter permease [Bacillota bacterium]HAN94143.1 sugar ABC transporter permease [Bacillota bacterium]
MPQIVINVVVIVAMLLWIVPTLGLLITSFRPASDVVYSGWWTVLTSPLKFTQYTVENYKAVLSSGGMSTAFRNSFIITVGGTVIPVFLASLAAFGLSKLHFRGRGLFYALIVFMLVVPTQMTFIPVLRLYNKLSLSGTFVGLWLVHTGYGLPFSIFMLHTFFQGLPDELFEAAYIDGASVWTSFFRLAIPLSVPALASLVIFQFLFVWNDLLVALIYLGGHESVAPLTVRLSSLVGSFGQDWHLLTAAAFVSMVVPIVVFFSLQQYFVRGLLGGAVKG